MKSDSFYLARQGEIVGPLSVEELERYQAAGKLESFNWMWDPKVAEWKPIDPKPKAAPEAFFKKEKESSVDAEAFCVMKDEIFKGELQGVSSFGCQFSIGGNSLTPPIVQKSVVTLWLCQNQQSPRAQKMRVGSVERKGTQWILHLRNEGVAAA